MNIHQWSDALEAALERLWKEGHPVAEIGRRLGMSKNSIVGKAHRLDLPSRPSPIIRSGDTRVPRAPIARRVRQGVSTLPPIAAAAPPPPPSLPTPEPEAASPLPETRYSISGQQTPFRVDDLRRPPMLGPTLRSTAAAAAHQRLNGTQASGRVTNTFPPERKCQYPHGEPRTKGFRFCHADVETPGPYCDDHRKRCYGGYRLIDDAQEAA